MAIINPGDVPINEAQVDGTELARRLERLYGAFHSQNSSATRPPAITAGALWAKTIAGGFDIMMFDGTNDIKIGGSTGNAGPQGPAGPTVVSAEAGNYSRLGSDGFLFTPTPPTVDLSAYETSAVANSRYVNVEGDAMTGGLSLPALTASLAVNILTSDGRTAPICVTGAAHFVVAGRDVPNRILVQGGYIPAGGQGVAPITFPIAFTSAPYVYACLDAFISDTQSLTIFHSGPSATGVTFHRRYVNDGGSVGPANQGFTWLAFGQVY